MSRSYNKWKWRVFVIAWLSYAGFYLCRVNISVALPAIRGELGAGESAMGLIGGIFLWFYAVGQLVNGTLGQRAKARWFVGIGMLSSAALCAAFGASSVLWLMALLWGVNGWVQSMGWGPIVKTIAAWFGSERRGRIVSLFGSCFVLGHLTAWAAGGWIVDHLGWRYAFWLPAAAFASLAAVWLIGVRSTPQEAGFTSANEARNAPDSLRAIFASLLAGRRVRWGALTCAFAGMVKDGLVLWSPFLLVDVLGETAADAALGASAMPLLGLAGTMLSGVLLDRVFRGRDAVAVIFLSLAVALTMPGFAVARMAGSRWGLIALLGLCGMLAYGINALLLTSLPLSFGNVAAVAGFLDFASYVGGGISAFTVGQLLDHYGWEAVFAYWLAATLLAAGGGVMLNERALPAAR